MVFTWLSKGIGFGFGFGFTTPFGWLVYLLWFWFYDSQVKTALFYNSKISKHSKQPGEARTELFVFIYKTRLGRSTVGVKNEDRIKNTVTNNKKGT